MKAVSREWFVLAFTDLFMASFAAVIILDLISPKFIIGEVGQDQPFVFEFSTVEKSFCNLNDFQSVTFKISDGDGEYTGFDLKQPRVKHATQTCRVSGVFEDIGNNIEQYCLHTVGNWPLEAKLHAMKSGTFDFRKENNKHNGGACD